ncbi:trypsin-like peptidase domain-containing protein [Streptomyces sp. NPDC057743]|uniref:trypsin-like peptidase domain-containing protein n=1 Tax=Streptomyces sp. NPDC057743 TaxID=3346236 RepID=UPI0036913B6D
MDDAKGAGPKPKWWSRPGPVPGPGQPAGGEAGEPTTGATGGEASGDWVVGPPRPATAPRVAGPATDAPPPAEAAREARDAQSSPGPVDVAQAAGGADAVDTAKGAEVAGAGGELTGPVGEIPGSAPVGESDVSNPPGERERVTGDATEDRPTEDRSAEVSLAKDRPADGRSSKTGAATPEHPAATMVLGAVPAHVPEQRGPAQGAEPAADAPRPDPRTAPAADSPAPPTGAAHAVDAQVAGDAPRQQPLHPEDPYGTPPYGGPGPWAPAPLVQRPTATPAHGTVVPNGAAPAPAAPRESELPPAAGAVGPEPAYAPGAAAEPAAGGFVPHPGDGGPRPAPPTAPGAWQHYDPWSAPRPGGPMAAPGAPDPRAPRRRGRRARLMAAAVVLALLAGGVGGVAGAYIERYGGLDDLKLPQAAGDAGGRSPESVAGIARAALPGVVTLHVRGNAEQGTGTGFVLDRQGHILTNNHVVEPAGTGGEISVTFSGGQTAKAKVIGRDGGYDLAVVQVRGVTGLHPLALGDSDAAQVGDPVVAIGAPYDLANTVTSGIISAKQRPITAGGKKPDGSDVSYVDALQTDAPINPGNSGGPLVDAKARVIGINSAIRAADSGTGGLDGGGQGGSIGLGFAIPINQARRVAEELVNTGRATHPVLGVTLAMEYAGDGARVSEDGKGGAPAVTPGGPGAKAGLQSGDVITEVDGAPVHSGEELIIKVRSHRPGDVLTLTVQRGDAQRSVRLTLGSATQG